MRALFALLLLIPLAGCISSDGMAGEAPDAALSEPRFDILPVEEAWVAMEDGKRIHNAVYRPDTTEPVPVFINFSPYWGDTAEEGGDNFAQYMVHEYVPRGYAVVLSAVRGTGHSEGCFQIAGDKELRDTRDVVDFFAEAEWSNGNVAAGGKSYDSTSQNGMVAKFPTPNLKALFHVSGITDMYRYNYREGVAYGHGAQFNTYYYFQGTDEYGAGVFGQDPGAATNEDPESLARLLDDVACPELPEIQAHGAGSGASGQKTDYWVERDWNRYIAESSWEGGVFFVHGLQDWNVKPDHILPWIDMQPDGVDVIGWLHDWQSPGPGGHVYPMRDDWNQTMLRFLDHYLKGIDTGLMDEPAYQVQARDGLWRTSEAWPVGDEQLLMLADLDMDCDPSCVEPRFALATADADPVRYTGAPVLTIQGAAVTVDPVATAVLYKVTEDGLVWVNEAVQRVIYRNGLESPDPVTVGETYEVTLEFYPQDDVLMPGETWLLALGESPRFARPPAGSATAQEDLEDAAITEFEFKGVTGEFRWQLAAPEPDAVQPVPMPCFAC